MIVGRVDARRAIPWPPLAAVALTIAVAGALAGPGRLVLHACVPGAGAPGWLGLRLALLRASVDCPDGFLAVGGTGASGALVVVSVAVPALLVHLLAVACGLSLSALLARTASGIAVVLGGVLRVLPGATHAPWTRPADVAYWALAWTPTRVPVGRHPDRGPPRAASAA